MACLRAAAMVATLLLWTLGGCSRPEPLSTLIERTNRDVSSRLGADVDVAALLADAAPQREALGPFITLRHAQEAALARNLALSAASEALPIAQWALVQAGLLANPTIGQSNGVLFPVSPGLGGAASFDVNIVQQLNSIFTRDARIGVAAAQRLQAGVDLASQAFELAMQVEEKYLEINHLDGLIDILRRVAETYDRASAAAQARSKVGVVPVTEVNRARVAALEAGRQVERARIRRRQSVRDLNFLMGAAPDTAWTLADEPAGRAIPGLADLTAAAIARSARLDLAHARLDERAGEASLDLAKAGLIPAITAGVEGAYTPGAGGASATVGPVFSVELPIFDSHRTALHAAEASLRRLRKATNALEAKAEADAVAACRAAELAASDLDFAVSTVIPQQRENVSLAQKAFQYGQIDLDSLLNTLRDASAAEQAAADARAALDAAQVALERALGVSLPVALQGWPVPAPASPAPDQDPQSPQDNAP